VADILGVLKRDPVASRAPVILFTKGGGQWLQTMADSGVDALGLDWTTDIREARERVGGRVALQGNLDPAALTGAPESIEREVKHVLDRFGSAHGHVFNLGHGITPDIDPENVAFLVNAVHELSRPYHR
jgi:uroporphyrinogen decarboxylase